MHLNSNKLIGLILLVACAQSCPAAGFEELIRTNQPGRMLTKENRVEYLAPSQPPVAAPTNQFLDFGDALRTLELSRATVRFTDWSQLHMKDRTRLEIIRRAEYTNSPEIHLSDGQIYFSSRGGAQRIPIETPHARGVPRGTEFLINVDAAAGRTEVTMFDGEVELSNGVSTKRVTTGNQGIAVPGQEIQLRPILEAKNIVQWWIYYPAVLDLPEIGLSVAEQLSFAASLDAYRSGELLRALQQYPGYPAPADPQTDAQRSYLAALFLSVGAVDRAEAQLIRASNTNTPSIDALRTMIAAVSGKGDRRTNSSGPLTASQQLALSFAHQATNNLPAALAAARFAVRQSANFGFGWARVGELEFSFGRTRAAREAIQRALILSPRNAQSHALNGFLLAAENRIHEAIKAFNRAIEIDPALGNAWLGRGLCKRRLGMFQRSETRNSKLETSTWLSDLQTAAILEPRRSLIRSYAGKAFSDVGDSRRAVKEFNYATRLDANDPTPWLYAALEKWQENRANEAVHDLEHSIALNDNRAVYRSRLLLDQDQATRSASLAKIYQNVGLDEVAIDEASKAVSDDYASHSAHQFLAESFNALRDPARFNLRDETVWFNELLLANILAPVGTGLLSQNISQQEYSRLFESDRLGGFSTTEYRSDGQLREIASQSGTYKNTSYSFDLDYQHNDGIRPNNGLDRIEWYAQFKHQFTPRDDLFVLTKYTDYSSGDNFQYYYATNARPHYQLSESQAPLLVAALHREWSPGMHTTLLAGRLESDQRASDVQAPQTIILKDASGAIASGFQHFNFDVDYRNQFTIWMTELNQIMQFDRHTLVFGGMFQAGNFQTHAKIFNPQAFTNYFTDPPADGQLNENFRRFEAYAYDTWRLHDKFLLTVGASYDNLDYPANFRSPPVAAGHAHRELPSPKVGAIWTPWRDVTLRGAYARNLGGASFDESFRLEPAQVAGFVQSFRSIISESVVGTVSAPETELRGAALDWKLPCRTYFGLQAEWLSSDVSGPVGVFYDNFLLGSQPEVFPGSLQRSLDYQEWSLAAQLTKLIGDEWSLGASYRFVKSQLHTVYPQVPVSLDSGADQTQKSELHQLGGFLQFNHPAGFFARAEASWYGQNNHGYSPGLPGDSFVQANIFTGWRLARRRAELTFGVLNLTGGDYRLNPLTTYNELPHERVFLARVRFNF